MISLEFLTVVRVESEYSTDTVRQACWRTWRIGQTEPVDVYFFVYKDTLQTEALKLVARGIRAASMVDGELTSEDRLAAYAEEGDRSDAEARKTQHAISPSTPLAGSQASRIQRSGPTFTSEATGL